MAVCSHAPPTYLPHLADSEDFCTFADDEEHPESGTRPLRVH